MVTLMIGVLHESNVAGPPDDLVTMLRPRGWEHFTTGDADAWVIPMDDTSYLLHWIESHGAHRADVLLDAIGEWADAEQFDGSLVCRPELSAMYARHGWRYAEPWHDGMIVMRRP